MKTKSLEELMDKHIGKVGTNSRDSFEHELKIDLLGEAIKKARKERNLTQSQLGELVGVKKAQISRLENNTKNVTVETIIRIFNAMKAEVNFNVQL